MAGWLIMLTWLMAGCAPNEPNTLVKLGTTKVEIGKLKVHAWIANTNDERANPRVCLAEELQQRGGAGVVSRDSLAHPEVVQALRSPTARMLGVGVRADLLQHPLEFPNRNAERRRREIEQAIEPLCLSSQPPGKLRLVVLSSMRFVYNEEIAVQSLGCCMRSDCDRAGRQSFDVAEQASLRLCEIEVPTYLRFA